MKKKIIVVYTMGKVGTTTIWNTLLAAYKEIHNKSNVEYSHTTGKFQSELVELYFMHWIQKENTPNSNRIKQCMQDDKFEVSFVVSFRDPLRKIISEFLYSEYHLENSLKKIEDLSQISTEFCRVYDGLYQYWFTWFSDEFEKTFNKSIHEIGMTERNNVVFNFQGGDVFCFKIESYEESFTDLERFIGVPLTKLSNKNVSGKNSKVNFLEEFGVSYDDLKNKIIGNLPSSYIIEFYDSFPSNCIYSKEECSNFKRTFLSESARKSKSFKFDMNCQTGENYGNHRSGWNWVVDGFANYESNESGPLLITFIEKDFWYEKNFDLIEKTMYRDWVGVAHSPHNIPSWIHDFDYAPQFKQSPEHLINTPLFKACRHRCRGIFTLTEYLAQEYRRLLPEIPIESLHHPTETPLNGFAFEKFINNPNKRIIQTGWWLRKMTSIYRLQLEKNNIRKTIVDQKQDWIDRLFDLCREREMPSNTELDPTVEVIERMSDDEYDEMLESNIIFLEMYDVSASNLICECVVRNTPLLINKLEPIVEYLGEDYPFYYSNLEEAGKMACDFTLIEKTYRYLLKRQDKHKFSRNFFVNSFVNSKIYKEL